jgi:hypothetical protein
MILLNWTALEEISHDKTTDSSAKSGGHTAAKQAARGLAGDRG